MELTLVPDADSATRAAVRAALDAAGVALGGGGEGYRSVWRAAGLVEAVDRRGAESGCDSGVYALSPRSTRGATRA